MPFSSNDSASRIREQTNNTLLQRAQQREKEQESRANKAVQDLADARIAHRRSQETADAQLDDLCVTLDTLIEFILLNHGEIPPKLAEIIAARQEQRITKSLPADDVVDPEPPLPGSPLMQPAGTSGQILKMQNGTVGWAPGPAKSAGDLTKEMLELMAGVRAD